MALKLGQGREGSWGVPGSWAVTQTPQHTHVLSWLL